MHPRLLLIIIAVFVSLSPAYGKTIFRGAIPSQDEFTMYHLPIEHVIKPPSLYDPIGKIDPFDPIFQEVIAATILPSKPKVPETELTRWALTQYTLTAIIRRSSGSVAFFITPDKAESYSGVVGDFIGQAGARIKEINRRSVLLTTGYVIKEVR